MFDIFGKEKSLSFLCKKNQVEKNSNSFFIGDSTEVIL